MCVLRPEVRYETRAAIGRFKIEQSGKPTSEKMTSHGSVSDLPADIVSVDRVLIRLGRKVIYVRCTNCSYNNVAKGIPLLDKKANFAYIGKISCK